MQNKKVNDSVAVRSIGSSLSCVLDDSLTVSEQNSQVNNPADLMINMVAQPKSMQSCLGTSSSTFSVKLSDLTKKQMLPMSPLTPTKKPVLHN